MRRMGAIVRRLYAEELKSAAADRAGSVKSGWFGARRKLSALKKALFKRRSIVWAIRIAAVLVVVLIVAEMVFQFNRFASWSTVVQARRADVAREYKRRENLLPNLVLAVSEYASYEQGVFRYVSDARDALSMIGDGDVPKAKTSSVWEQLSPRLIALAEQYPDLKTSGAIESLIAESALTEDREA